MLCVNKSVVAFVDSKALLRCL